MVAKAATPNIISIKAPVKAIHFLNKGALLRSQPETPPSSSMGEMVVPKPNSTAKRKLSIGLPKGIEYKRSIANGGQIINPRLKPSEKAPASNLPERLFVFIVVFPAGGQLHVVARLFIKTTVPISIVTIPKTKEEYC